MELLKTFPEYKALLFKLLFLNDKIKTIDAHNYLKLEMQDKAPSRASTINFLADLAESGYATFNEESGKGGFHRVYSMAMPKDEALEKLQKEVFTEFWEKIAKNLVAE